MSTQLIGRSSLAAALLSLAIVGCNEQASDGDEGEGAGVVGGNGEGAGPANTGGGGDGGGGAGPTVEPPQELFACTNTELLWGCSMTFHISPEPSDAPNCMAQLVSSGMPGTVRTSYQPGPDVHFSDTLMIFLGDGTALKQKRFKGCMGCDPSSLLWGEPSDVEVCDVVVPQALIDACEAGDPEGCWLDAESTLENCQPMTAQPSCTEAVEMLSNDGPACDDDTCGAGQACFDYITDMSTGTQCAMINDGCFDCGCAVQTCTDPAAATCEIVDGGFHVSNCQFPI
jgi:hypothetical protein